MGVSLTAHECESFELAAHEVVADPALLLEGGILLVLVRSVEVDGLVLHVVQECLVAHIVEVEINAPAQQDRVALDEGGEHVVVGGMRVADIQVRGS